MARIIPFILLLSLTSTLPAASPSIESVSPGIGQRGMEFELKLVGAGLADAEEVMFYRPGVACRDILIDSEYEVTLRLIAATDTSLGDHPFRIRTRYGMTELHTFRLTPFPVVESLESNDTLLSAQAVDRNVTIVGQMGSDDVDCYKLAMRRGERLSAEVEAIRLGATLLDLKLTVFAPSGNLVAAVDDTSLFQQDPFLTILAEEDGDYVVQVAESGSERGGDNFYALHLGTFPRPAAVFPLGGPAGEVTDFQFLGDAAGVLTQQVKLPTTASQFRGLYAEDGGILSPTPNPIRISLFPNVMETNTVRGEVRSESPLDSKDEEPEVALLPAAFNGVLSAPGESDRFLFQANEGERWQFELFADRLGSPLDGVLTIFSSAGEVLAFSDDYASLDGKVTFPCMETGLYWLRIHDKRGDGGPGFVYRVEAAKPAPNLTAFLPRPDRRSQESQTVWIPRGNRVVKLLGVQRTEDIGDVVLRISGLPDGVDTSGGTVDSDRYWTPVLFEAGSDAPVSGRLVSIRGEGEFNGERIHGDFRQVVDLVAGSADSLFYGMEVDRLGVAVTEPVPLRVHLTPPTKPLPRDGTISLQVTLERGDDFDSPVDISLPALPPWVDGPAKITIPGSESSGVIVLRAWEQAEPRSWPICVEARSTVVAGVASLPTTEAGDEDSRKPQSVGGARTGSRRDFQIASNLCTLTIAEAPIASLAPRVAGEQGESVKITFPLTITGPLPNPLVATLEGLPNRAVVASVSVDTALPDPVQLNIQLPRDAPLGEFTGLVCRLSGSVDGQDISYCVGRGGTLIIEPTGGLMTDDTGRPLSKLELLRKNKQSVTRVPTNADSD
jgi:hypothetical protein